MKFDKIGISGREDLKRDSSTNAILSCDKAKLLEAKRLKKENLRYINLEQRIATLEQKIEMLLKGKNQ
jgi:hypothetical protein